MNTIAASRTLPEFVSAIQARYRHVTPGQRGHNSLGFNSDELKTAVDVSYYGCSFTHGEGVESNQRWTDIIDQRMGYSANNFGISGSCIQDILQVFAATTRFVRMRRAVFLLPDYARTTLAVDQDVAGDFKYINIYPADTTDTTSSDKLIRSWLSWPDAYYADCAKTWIDLIDYIADINGIEARYSSWSPEVFELLPRARSTGQCIPNDRLGSDRVHPGPEFHRRLAEEFIAIL